MKIKRMIAAVLAAVMMSSALAGCGNKTDDSDVSSGKYAVTRSTEEKPDNTPKTDEEWHEAMIDKAMLSYGCPSVMQEKLKAAKNGEALNISYLGGSITEGMTVTPAYPEKCWAYLTYEHIKEKFGSGDGSNVTYNNAGIAGTPSKLGVLRLDRDILPTDPDICFVEFAVNDGGDGEYAQAYESIIRRLIENDVAVVLIFAVTEDGHSCQDYFMQDQGSYYDLPMISYRDALQYMFDNGKMTWQDFSDDQSHPNEAGHALVAEMINYYFDTVMDKAEEDYIYPPEPLTEVRPYGAHFYDNTNLEPVDKGSWYAGSETAHFTDGWSFNQYKDGNDPIKFKFTGKFVYMLYHEVAAGAWGKAHIVVKQDGEVYDDFEFSPIDPNGWGNCQVKCIGMSPKNCEYEIEISMCDGDEGNAFSLLGFGYTIDE